MLEYRDKDPYIIDKENISKLKKYVFPYWKERNIETYARKWFEPETEKLLNILGCYILTEFAGTSHLTLDHEKAFELGFNGLIKQAEERKENFKDSKEKQTFLQAIIETLRVKISTIMVGYLLLFAP